MLSDREYAQRRAQLELMVKEAGLDGFLVSSREGIYYLTGASYVPEERPFFILICPERKTVLIVPELERTHMQKAGIGKVMAYAEFPAPQGLGWSEVLLAAAGDLTSLGVEPGLALERMEKINALFPRVSHLLEKMRQIKSPGEIRAIEATAAWSDLGMQKIMAASYSGATVAEIFSVSKGLQTRMIRETPYDPVESTLITVAWPAPLSAQPHAVPKVGDRMGKGPLVAMAYFRVNGYAAEVERTYFHHDPTADQRDVFHHMQEARALGVSMVRPGVSCHEVDRAVNEFLVTKGYGDYLLHRTGHGIGLGNHEGPYLAMGSPDTLKENMVVSIEPGIYIPGVGGFRHSDTYVVTPHGCRPLTRYPDSLEDLVIRSVKPLQRFRGILVRYALGIKGD